MSETKYLYKDKYTSELPLTPWEIDKAIRRAPGPAWLTTTEKAFLWCLNSHGDDVYPSYATLRRETGIASDATIRKTINSLVAKGWLVCASGNRVESNEYQILVPGTVQRVSKVSKAGNQYMDFLFTDTPPGYVPRISARGKSARESRGSTPTVEATTASVGPGTTASVDKVKIVSKKESNKGLSAQVISSFDIYPPSASGTASAASDLDLDFSQVLTLGPTASVGPPKTGKLPPGYIRVHGQVMKEEDFYRQAEEMREDYE